MNKTLLKNTPRGPIHTSRNRAVEIRQINEEFANVPRLDGDVTITESWTFTQPITVPAGSIPINRLEDIGANTVLCRPSGVSGPVLQHTMGSNTVLARGPGTIVSLFAPVSTVLRRTASGVLGFGQLETGHLGDASVTFAKLQNIGGFTLMGNPTTGAGSPTEFVVGSNALVGRAGTGSMGGVALGTSSLYLRQTTGALQSYQPPSDTVVGRDGPGALSGIKITQAHLASSFYDTAVVELGGDFDSGSEVKCVRTGDQVTITGVGTLTHTSSSSPSSNVGVIPAAFRPTSSLANKYNMVGSDLMRIVVSSAGTVLLGYRDFSGSASARTNSSSPPSIAYNIT